MKNLLALCLAVAFAAGTVGVASAQPRKPDDKNPAEKKIAVKTASGTVKSASADSLVVATKAGGKDTEYTFALDPKTIIGKEGKGAAPGDLKTGDQVTVRYTEQDGKSHAQRITVTAKKATAKPPAKP
ncbi:MAG: hypothetical protein ACREJ9_14905 [Candidatus Rokuibacteriota bacterium]